MGIRCADHVTPLYPQKLALTSPTGGGRFVGIVRSRTKATEFSLVSLVVFIIDYAVVKNKWNAPVGLFCEEFVAKFVRLLNQASSAFC